MHTNEPRELQGVDLGYDPRDIHVKNITRTVIFFFVFTLVSFGGVAIWYIASGQNVASKIDKRKSSFTGPRVQSNVTAKVEIMEMRQNERKMMTTYGQNQDGSIRIPVDRAIKVLASRGLPEVSSEAPAQSTGTTITQNAVQPAR